MSLALQARGYLAHLAASGRSASAQTTVAHALARFVEHARSEGVRESRDVSEAHVVSFTRHLAGKPSRRGGLLATSTQALHLSAVRAFFAFLEGQGALLMNPAQGVPLPKVFRLPRALSERYVRRLLDAPAADLLGSRDRAMLELLYGTGLRLSECLGLDLPDVDLDQGLVLVRDGKGRKDRYVPLPKGILDVLRAYVRESRPVLMRRSSELAFFVSRRGRRLGGVRGRQLVRHHGEAAGVKVSPHVLRHSYATHLLAGGADIREIQKLLGHEHITTTALYTRVDTRGLARMLRRCHPRP